VDRIENTDRRRKGADTFGFAVKMALVSQFLGVESLLVVDLGAETSSLSGIYSRDTPNALLIYPQRSNTDSEILMIGPYEVHYVLDCLECNHTLCDSCRQEVTR
jgi:hypothetical protein